MTEKMTGYLLLIAGLGIIAFSAISVYLVFTGKAQAVALFDFKDVSLPVSALLGSSAPPGTEDTQIELFPASDLNQTTNTFAHLFLMGFIASIGYRVATIGTSLVRPIVINMEGKRVQSVLDPVPQNNKNG